MTSPISGTHAWSAHSSTTISLTGVPTRCAVSTATTSTMIPNGSYTSGIETRRVCARTVTRRCASKASASACTARRGRPKPRMILARLRLSWTTTAIALPVDVLSWPSR